MAKMGRPKLEGARVVKIDSRLSKKTHREMIKFMRSSNLKSRSQAISVLIELGLGIAAE